MSSWLLLPNRKPSQKGTETTNPLHSKSSRLVQPSCQSKPQCDLRLCRADLEKIKADRFCPSQPRYPSFVRLNCRRRQRSPKHSATLHSRWCFRQWLSRSGLGSVTRQIRWPEAASQFRITPTWLPVTPVAAGSQASSNRHDATRQPVAAGEAAGYLRRKISQASRSAAAARAARAFRRSSLPNRQPRRVTPRRPPASTTFGSFMPTSVWRLRVVVNSLPNLWKLHASGRIAFEVVLPTSDRRPISAAWAATIPTVTLKVSAGMRNQQVPCRIRQPAESAESNGQRCDGCSPPPATGVTGQGRTGRDDIFAIRPALPDGLFVHATTAGPLALFLGMLFFFLAAQDAGRRPAFRIRSRRSLLAIPILGPEMLTALKVPPSSRI